MAKMNTKNTWGSNSTAGGTGLDQQRADLFRISLTLPIGGVNTWDEQVQFAVEGFPFPDMKVTTFDTKYLNQTNHQIGADTSNSEIMFGMLSLCKLPRSFTSGCTSFPIQLLAEQG